MYPRVIAHGTLSLAIPLAGCKRNPPGRLEANAMYAAKHHISVRGKSQKNPMADSVATIADGRGAFSLYCAACHGLDVQNTGVPLAESMPPPVSPASSNKVRAYTDSRLKWVIDYGIPPSGMPGLKDVLSGFEIWSIVAFLRHLPPAGNLGEPEMYSH